MVTKEATVHLPDRFDPGSALCGVIPLEDGDDEVLDEFDIASGRANCPECLGDGEE